MKAALPWEYRSHGADGRFCGVYCMEDYYNPVMEEWVRLCYVNNTAFVAAAVQGFRSSLEEYYRVGIHSSIVVKDATIKFYSLEEAMAYADNMLVKNGIRLLQEHMLVLL